MLYPEHARAWHQESNTLALLSVADERALGVLLQRAIDRDFSVAPFREPDRENELTAIALGPEGRKLTRGLPLALNDATPRRPHASVAVQPQADAEAARSSPAPAP